MAAEQRREDKQSVGRGVRLGRQAGTLATTAILSAWVTFPSGVVPTLGACCAALVLTSDYGREEASEKHLGRPKQPQASWVPLPLGEAGALNPGRMSIRHGTGPGRHCLHPSAGMALTTTQDWQKQEGVSFSVKIESLRMSLGQLTKGAVRS